MGVTLTLFARLLTSLFCVRETWLAWVPVPASMRWGESLWEAAQQGRLEELDALLRVGNEWQAIAKALKVAIVNDCVECVAHIKERHDVRSFSWGKHTATLLEVAAASNSMRTLEALLALGMPVLTRAVNFAVYHGHADAVKLLLGAGAIVPADSLCKAAAVGDADTVRVLLEAKAYVGGQGGVPVLVHAARHGHCVPVAQLLLDAKASLAVGSFDNGRTPLYQAVWNVCSVEFANVLLQAKADPNNYGRSGLLHQAAMCCAAPVVRALLEAGARVNATNRMGTTPLHEAGLASDPGTVDCLLAFKADVDAVSEPARRTPLHEMTFWNKPQSVAALIGAGANVDARDCQGHTPLHFARSEACVRLLVGAKASLDAANDAGYLPSQHPLCTLLRTAT
jgi:ankyrin repeat protein